MKMIAANESAKMCIRDRSHQRAGCALHRGTDPDSREPYPLARRASIREHHNRDCLLYTSGDETGGGNGHLVLVVEPVLAVYGDDGVEDILGTLGLYIRIRCV